MGSGHGEKWPEAENSAKEILAKKPGKRLSLPGFLSTSVRLGWCAVVRQVERTLLTDSFWLLRLPNFIYLKAERGFTNLVCEKAFAVAEGNEGSANQSHTDSPREPGSTYDTANAASQAGVVKRSICT